MDHFFTGRFHGHLDAGPRIGQAFEDLSLDEALAWARERADAIEVRIGYGPTYGIGRSGDGVVPFPPEGLAAPPRRRVPEEAWKDRTDADPDARWVATLSLVPPAPAAGEPDRRRPEWDEVAGRVADAVGGSWSAEELDAWLALARTWDRRARRSPTGEVGYATSLARAYAVAFEVTAPTEPRARAAAEAAVPALPPGWSAAVTVAFAGD